MMYWSYLLLNNVFTNVYIYIYIFNRSKDTKYIDTDDNDTKPNGLICATGQNLFLFLCQMSLYQESYFI